MDTYIPNLRLAFFLTTTKTYTLLLISCCLEYKSNSFKTHNLRLMIEAYVKKSHHIRSIYSTSHNECNSKIVPIILELTIFYQCKKFICSYYSHRIAIKDMTNTSMPTKQCSHRCQFLKFEIIFRLCVYIVNFYCLCNKIII